VVLISKLLVQPSEAV